MKVVINWKDFSGPPTTRDEALALMREQYPGTVEEASHSLHTVALAHQEAVGSVPRHVRVIKPFPFATSWDIDHKAVDAHVASVAPDIPPSWRAALVGWVVHWHWVR